MPRSMPQSRPSHITRAKSSLEPSRVRPASRPVHQTARFRIDWPKAVAELRPADGWHCRLAGDLETTSCRGGARRRGLVSQRSEASGGSISGGVFSLWRRHKQPQAAEPRVPDTSGSSAHGNPDPSDPPGPGPAPGKLHFTQLTMSSSSSLLRRLR
ncbi:unnamed protein product [Protopolystoma xenopodis]|uniref:Uncharacterized protein n=1 Tax=Protopolystoma xenopodis TaxID=117903 RepID=A0A3S4ZYV1_9PLAT|nr:unnamed protein product [Protopolystoma xenopodis]